MVEGDSDDGYGPLPDGGVRQAVGGLVRDVGPEWGKGGMGDAARVSELTPLTGRDK